MPKKKLSAHIDSYGLYTPWDSKSKELPNLVKFTTDIPVQHGVEFGYILNIKGGRGEKVRFQIEHPPFLGSDGEVAPTFTGEMHIRSNDYHLFLGDSVWDPLEDKAGAWCISTFHKEKLLAQKRFMLHLPRQEESRT